MSLRKLQCALPDLIGRTIEHVVVSQHEPYRSQLFLFFTDGTHYEFYGDHINGIRHLTMGGLEITGGEGYIPERGRLEVLDAKTAIILERPAPVTAAIAAPAPVPSSPQQKKRWRSRIANWFP